MIVSDYAKMDLEQLHALKRRVDPTGPHFEKISAAIEAKIAPTPKYRPSQVRLELQDEGDVEQDVDAELDRLGFDITRFSQPRRSKQTEGIPDRYARHRLRKCRLWIEVKQPGGTVSDDQKRWHKTERDSGGDVVTVWSVRDLHDELRARGFNP